MNENQLFEVGLSETYGGAYWEKFYVVAIGTMEAIDKAKARAVSDAMKEDDGAFETEADRKEHIKIAKGLYATKVLCLGEVLV